MFFNLLRFLKKEPEISFNTQKTELKNENITKDKDVALKTESKKEKLKTEKK